MIPHRDPLKPSTRRSRRKAAQFRATESPAQPPATPAAVHILPPLRVAIGPPGQEVVVELGVGIRRSIARYLACGRLR